jgi:hypothetical protein
MDTSKIEPRHLAAPAELVVNACGSYSWDLSECPLCGATDHRHGGGTLNEDPRAYLFHRVAHCLTGPSAAMVAAAAALNISLCGYILTDADTRRSAELIRLQADEDAEFEDIRMDGVAA